MIAITYDQEADAVYIKVSENKVVRTKEEKEGLVIIDLDYKGNLVGIEFISPKTIEITEYRRLMPRLARNYHQPGLRDLRPRRIPAIYAQ